MRAIENLCREVKSLEDEHRGRIMCFNNFAFWYKVNDAALIHPVRLLPAAAAFHLPPASHP